MAYITTTHLLERIHPDTLVVNDPAQVRNAPEKTLRHAVPRPDAADADRARPEEIRAFRKEHGDIIIKPLYGNGGAGVFRIAEGDQNLAALLEIFATAFREPHVVQRYLPEVQEGRQAHHPDRRRRRPARSTACRRRARRAPTCMSAAAPSRRR